MPAPMKAPTNAAHLTSSRSIPRQMATVVKAKQTANDTKPGEFQEPGWFTLPAAIPSG